MRRILITAFITFISGSIVASALFWMAYGHNLKYDIYHGVNGESSYMYSESFSLRGRIIITAMAGLVAGLLVSVMVAVTTYLTSRTHSHRNR